MQPSDTSEPQVVLLCGISGSGKTHYALGLQAEGYRRLTPLYRYFTRLTPIPD